MVLQEIINNYRATGELSHKEIVFLLGLEKPDEVGGLLALANEVREKHLGPDVHLRYHRIFQSLRPPLRILRPLLRQPGIKTVSYAPYEILDTAAGAVEMGFEPSFAVR